MPLLFTLDCNISMLSQVSALPPGTKPGFHDYLTGDLYLLRDGKLVCESPTLPKSSLPYHPTDYSSSVTPECFLHKLTPVSGKALINCEGTIVSSASTSSCEVRSTLAIRKRMCWQIHAPISLNQIQLGICSIGENGKCSAKPLTFSASTSRTVTFMVEDDCIRAWVNQSVPNKNHTIPLPEDFGQWYPYIKINGNGITLIFNGFATEPNKKISKYNPFNEINSSIPEPKIQLKSKESPTEMLKIAEIKQLDQDRMLLISQDHRIKIIRRNPDSLLMEIPELWCEKDQLFNFFTPQEWKKITHFCELSQISVPKIEFFSNSGASISELAELLRYLFVKIDSVENISDSQNYHETIYLLTVKLAILRSYSPKFIPNHIFNCELDRSLTHYSSQYFQKSACQPFRTIPKQVIANTLPWTKIQGQSVRIVDVTSSYLCAHVKDENSDDAIVIYHLGELYNKKVFAEKLQNKKLSFGKKKFLEEFASQEITSLWQENNEDPQIYKILTSCFKSDNNRQNKNIFAVNDKDIRELTEDFKIEKEEAIFALEQCGDVAEALIWLSSEKREITRLRPKEKNMQQAVEDKEDQVTMSMIQLSNHLVSRVLLQIRNQVYVLGFNPSVVNVKYLRKTSKGFINLSTFSFENCIKFVDTTKWVSSFNHESLSILDASEICFPCDHDKMFLFRQNGEIRVAYEDNDILMKTNLKFKEDLVYNENCSIEISAEGQAFDDVQFIESEKVVRTIHGEIFATVDEANRIVNPSAIYAQGTALFRHQFLYSNIKVVKNIDNTQNNHLDLWFHFKEHPTLSFPQKQRSNSYLPLLVERGPPGCNLNYPICSILYPRSPLPFLANYPYSLTFRNLHSKYMRVEEVTIERIGSKKNINEIKEGHIYFTNHSSIESKKYHFAFHSNEDSSLVVQIQETMYWKYMIIEPIYSDRKKMPYQIGFVGAKGSSVDVEEYEKSWLNEIQDHISLHSETNMKVAFSLVEMKELGDGVITTSLKVNGEKECPKVDSKWNVVMQNWHSEDNQGEDQSNEAEKRIKPHQLVEMNPKEIMKLLLSTVSRNGFLSNKNLSYFILHEMAKNQNITFAGYPSLEIRQLVDMINYYQVLSEQEFEQLYNKIHVQSTEGAKYLDDLLKDLGKGYYMVNSKYLPFIIKRLFQSKEPLHEVILEDLLVCIEKSRDKRYQILQRNYQIPYLLFEKDYYSNYYYEKIQSAANRPTGKNLPCQEIFHEKAISSYSYIITREDLARKIIIKFNGVFAIRKLLLRFDRTEVKNKAVIKVYAWEKGERKAVGQTLLHEHQWIQVTKNPYTPQMTQMFAHNQEWLNGFGVLLEKKVETNYLEIELFFTVTGITGEQRELQSAPLIDIIPEIFGSSVRGVAEPDAILTLEKNYFEISEEQKFFISKLPAHLQLSQPSSSAFLNKYLVNKHGIAAEYHYFEPADRNVGDASLEKKNEEALDFMEKLNSLMDNPSQNQSSEISALMNSYHSVMSSLSTENQVIRYHPKPSLDYLYTAIMQLLEHGKDKNIKFSHSICQKLIAKIIKKDIGPIALSAFEAISLHPDLLLNSFEFIRITVDGENVPSHLSSIPAHALKGTELTITQEDIDQIVRSEKRIVAESLVNLITSKMAANELTVKYCIKLSKLAGDKNGQIFDYILTLRKSEAPLFKTLEIQKLEECVLKYIFSSSVTERIRREKFIDELSNEELGDLIASCRKIMQKDPNCMPQLVPNDLICKLLNSSTLTEISIEIVSFIFDLKLGLNEQWEHLSRCISICPQAEEMIYCQYLSYNREQKECLLELVVFHREILYSSIKSEKNSELFVAFLQELYHCSRQIFIDVVLGLPQDGSISPIHEDIYIIVIQILNSHCNVGGVQGAKCITFAENRWLAVAQTLLKLSKKDWNEKDLSDHDIEHLITWFLLNNNYELNLMNPVNRSPAVNNIRDISESVLNILNKSGTACSINKILRAYKEIKEAIKSDNIKLLSHKYIVLNRIQHGVSKLLQNSVDPEGLTDVLIGKEGILNVIVDDLSDEVEKTKVGRDAKWDGFKDKDLTEDLEAHIYQAQKLVHMPVKDWQAARNGGKSFACKISTSVKRVLLNYKEQKPIAMHKFIVGFNIQDNAEKNIVLPDHIELYGSKNHIGSEGLKTFPQGVIMHKICDLQVLEDQNYYQHGIKLFGVNFNTLTRNYRNQVYGALEIRLKSEIMPSCSDVLENNIKTMKSSSFHLSFLSISAHENQPSSSPSYGQIYMKLLSFLSNPKYSSTLKSLTSGASNSSFSKIFPRLISVLNFKSLEESENSELADQILSALAQQKVPVLEQLLKQSSVNNRVVKKILEDNLNIGQIDMVLSDTLTKNCTEDAIENIVENVRLYSYSGEEPSQSVFSSQEKFESIYKIYSKAVKSLKHEDYLSANKKTPIHSLYRRVLGCMMSSSKVFQLPILKIVQKLLEAEQKEEGSLHFSYPVIASCCHASIELLKWLKESGTVKKVAANLLSAMKQVKESEEKSKVVRVFNCIYFLCSIIQYKPNLEALSTPNSELLPISVMELLQKEEKLIVQYPTEVIKYFVSFFQSTCTSSSHEKCATKFAERLINLMANIPNVSAQYHHYFIHEFFFPLINSYNGVNISFIWTQDGKIISKITQALKKSPIRKNDSILKENNKYFKISTNKDEVKAASHVIVLKKEGKEKIAERLSGEWNVVSCLIKEVLFEEEGLKVIPQNGQPQILKLTNEVYDIFVGDSSIPDEMNKLLVNSTLQKVQKPFIFEKQYRAVQPASMGLFDHLYTLPLEMTLQDMFKKINICGFKIDEETIKSNSISFKVCDISSGSIKMETKLSEIMALFSEGKPLIELEINADDIFKNSTIEKMSKQLDEQQAIKFVPQETVFKYFEKLKGLDKMIKVMITCVKNWKNVEQSKIWLQYLNQLESFSCFPVFSSIYMAKQENVELLFDILSGLPDKEDNKKWLEKEKKSVKFLYDIIKNVFEVEGEQAQVIRNYAIKSGFYETMLERLHLVTKEPKRYKNEESDEEEEIELPQNLQKKNSEQEYKKEIKKKKGIGYGTDSSSNQKWDITGHEEAKKELADQIVGLVKILQKFLNHPEFAIPHSLLETSFNSCLLPLLESSMRGGSLLEISKNAELFNAELEFIKALAKKQTLIPCLMEIPKCYEPKQSESIFSLIKTLEGTSKIFLSCLTGSVSEKTSEQIAKNIMATFKVVDDAISKYKQGHIDKDEEKRILELPLAKKYPILLKDLRFDYIDMKDKNGTFKHHYSSSYQKNHTSPATKTIRLAQELADISHALPIDHTNAIFVRCDKERVDFMQALIMGSNGTPYGHGAYLFDIHFEDGYPSGPPKVNLTTTGSGQIRFNPNLYSCGKVCLSLLGTWRGNAMENWDSKVSTLLQVLVSIQSIIMAEEVYFNEPGFEHEQGTVEGEKKNEAYSNVVRYGNIKFAMIDNLKNPPKGFETIIRRHFYLKKDEIMEQCKKWLKFAEKREASYTGLVSDHNNNWCTKFRKSKTEYKTMLEQAIKELERELNKLPEPSYRDLEKEKKEDEVKKKEKKVKVVEKDENLEQVDVTYEKKENQSNFKELDINDEKVKDRWSRYIGAMGIEAVSKQSKANIVMFGLSSLGIEIAKNIVLSGCKRFSVCDEAITTWNDLSGQFYLSEEDVGKSRVEACLYKLQELNNYVRVDSVKINTSNLQLLKEYDVVVTTSELHNKAELLAINNYCHQNAIKFTIAKCEGPYGYVFNDFGDNFQVTDKNGEETVECMVQNISNAEEGVVTLLKGVRHPYEDGDVIRITNVKGMQSKTEEGKTINETVQKIKVINPFSFTIGNTLNYSEYKGNGLVRNMKLPITINFKKLEDSMKEVNIDQNLEYYDFTKGMNSRMLHHCFSTLCDLRAKNENKGEFPRPWNWEDSEKFIQEYKASLTEQKQLDQNEIDFIRRFSLTCSGTFAPLCAYYGGLVAQQVFKAITSKYMPINQYFFTDFTEVIDDLPKQSEAWKESVESRKYESQENRFQGLRRIVGDTILDKIRSCKVFVVGSGAIGCELLKNYAMINVATNQEQGKGEIVVTDPDHIEVSNLNRQFLFREKHLQKPKSSTAAAAVKQMNKYLTKNKVRAKLIKVCEATKDTFSNEFFESMDIVTNALDNVQARQYIDLRCVENKVALLESGTLSSKGHVQTIIPYKTETYGSKADPAEDGEIPHCTLKMFPEETLHCVEWARDIFGKTFTMKPKALLKILESLETYNPIQSQISVLKDSLKMLETKPSNFDDAVFAAAQEFYQCFRNDIKQLLYTYPLDSKTKDGKDFWKLPKRPPTPIEEINPEIQIHGEFIASYAVLLCKIFGVPYPKDFRTEAKRKEIAKQAAKIKIEPFVPSDKLAKQMATEVEDNNKDGEEKEKEEPVIEINENVVEIFKELKLLVQEEKQMGTKFTISAEQFEKDDDANGHIDLIYSMANLRASNYKLDPMDWITTKLKAGRITPALSTTTSCIAALQTVELIKYMKDIPLEKMRNYFINLAVPMIQTNEPGEVEKIKIHEDLTTNIWQRWSLDPIDYQNIIISDLISKIEEKFKVSVKTLGVVEGGHIFSDLVLGLESKKKEKEEFMKRKLKDLVTEEGSWEEGKKYIDLTLVMSVGEQFIKHVPTVRIPFL